MLLKNSKKTVFQSFFWMKDALWCSAQTVLSPVFLPHSWQLFISKADQNSLSIERLRPICSDPGPLDDSTPWWTCYSSFSCCSLTHLRAELSCLVADSFLVVQQQQQPAAWTRSIQPSSLHPLHPLHPLPLSTPSSLPHKLHKKNNYHPGKLGLFIQNRLHYVTDEVSLNMRRSVWKSAAWILQNKDDDPWKVTSINGRSHLSRVGSHLCFWHSPLDGARTDVWMCV